MSRTKRWIAQQKFRELRNEDLPTYKVGDLFREKNTGKVATLSKIRERVVCRVGSDGALKKKYFTLFKDGQEVELLEVQLRVAYDYLTPSK